MKLENGMIVIAPISTKKGITQGKDYVIREVNLSFNRPSFWITTDKGLDAYCLLTGCSWIGDRDWVVKIPEKYLVSYYAEVNDECVEKELVVVSYGIETVIPEFEKNIRRYKYVYAIERMRNVFPE